MNKQQIAWDNEYRNPKLVTKKEEPQADTLRFFKFLKKEEGFRVEDRKVLDLGRRYGKDPAFCCTP